MTANPRQPGTTAEPSSDDMPPEEEQEFLRAVDEAIADKRPSIPFEKVRAWLLSWGTANELPPPE